MTRRIPLLVSAGLAAVALILLIICAVIVVDTRSFLADSVATTGTVTALVPRQSCSDERSDGERDGERVRSCSTVYAPKVRFRTADGREVEFTSDVASSPAGYAEGDPIAVRYRPGRPQDARVDSITGSWLGALITGGIGLAFLAFAALWFVIARRAPLVAEAPYVEPQFSDQEWDAAGEEPARPPRDRDPDHPEQEPDKDPDNPFV